ncbi:MAG: 3-isopropylmalate dehydrogenase [Rhizobiales bacterium]|nr:3-isopropylmalate dehydrogenase [Hyphomicrobiales bacterium]
MGKEIIPEAVKVLTALSGDGFRPEFEEAHIGGAGVDAAADPLPPATLDLARRADAILFGAVGAPKYEHLPRNKRPGLGLLRLRKELGFFANYRPAKLLPELRNASTLKAEVVDGLDILILRELNGDIYFGEPRGRVEAAGQEREAINTMRYKEYEVARIAHVAFRVARTRKRKVLSVDKANVLETMVLWREVMTEVGRDYPDVELSHMYVDAAAMSLLRAPTSYDVVVTGNMFGDILSDLTAMMTGSIGMLPSAALGESTKGLYEPIHGSAPDIAGQDIANPLATILSAAMLLRYSCERADLADRVELAVRKVLADGLRTGDIREPGARIVGTREMGDAVVAALQA